MSRPQPRACFMEVCIPYTFTPPTTPIEMTATSHLFSISTHLPVPSLLLLYQVVTIPLQLHRMLSSKLWVQFCMGVQVFHISFLRHSPRRALYITVSFKVVSFCSLLRSVVFLSKSLLTRLPRTYHISGTWYLDMKSFI